MYILLELVMIEIATTGETHHITIVTDQQHSLDHHPIIDVLAQREMIITKIGLLTAIGHFPEEEMVITHDRALNLKEGERDQNQGLINKVIIIDRG